MSREVLSASALIEVVGQVVAGTVTCTQCGRPCAAFLRSGPGEETGYAVHGLCALRAFEDQAASKGGRAAVLLEDYLEQQHEDLDDVFDCEPTEFRSYYDGQPPFPVEWLVEAA